MKTVRFTKIVEEAGTPEPYTLWLPPEKDPHLQAAIKAHRVMTVHQENTGHASDFGEVGFAKEVQGSFLLFPKSLKRYEGRRVVGVKYDLLKETPSFERATRRVLRVLVAYDCRIVFSKQKSPNSNRDILLLIDIGTHEEVY